MRFAPVASWRKLCAVFGTTESNNFNSMTPSSTEPRATRRKTFSLEKAGGFQPAKTSGGRTLGQSVCRVCCVGQPQLGARLCRLESIRGDLGLRFGWGLVGDEGDTSDRFDVVVEIVDVGCDWSCGGERGRVERLERVDLRGILRDRVGVVEFDLSIEIWYGGFCTLPECEI